MEYLLNRPATSRATKGYLIALVGTAIWSSTAVFIGYLTETYHLPPLVLAFWRDFFVTVGLSAAFVIFAPALLRLDRRQVGFIIAYGLVLSLFNSFWTWAVALNGAAVATVLVYSSPAFTVIAGFWLFGERFDIPKLLAVPLSIIGCVFVAGAFDPQVWQINPLGIATGLIGGIGFAAYSLMGKAAAHRQINPWTATLYTFAAAAVFLLSYNVIGSAASFFVTGSLQSVRAPELFWLGDSVVGWGILLLLALGPTIGGYGLYTVSLTYLPASVANLIATLEPSMTAVLAYIFLHEHLTGPQLIGSGLIIAGVVILRLGEGRRAPTADESLPSAAG
jgi:drug/metabolite transporter (DMT)-like permease